MSIAVLLMATPAQAQNRSGKASASIDSSTILIGDHVHLTIEYTLPAHSQLQWPVFKDTLSQNIELVESGKIDTVSKGSSGELKLKQILTITCFDSGSFVIPPIPITNQFKGDTTTYIAYTQALNLNVNTVAVDTTQAIKDIKAPMTSPITLMEILPWVLGGIILLAVIALVIYVIVRRKKNKPVFARSAAPPLPAHIQALNALETLRQERLWQQGKVKEYQSRISEILREYISNRYHIGAPEMITPEVISHLEALKAITPDDLKRCRMVLELSDMVKFAKFIPIPDEHDNSLRNSVQFVENTAEKSIEVTTPAIGDDQDFITKELRDQELHKTDNK